MTTVDKENLCVNRPASWIVWTLRSLCAIAICITVYLAWTSLTGSQVAGCNSEIADCNSVLKTKWSSVFGIPVSIFAFNLYVLALAALWLSSTHVPTKAQEIAWRVVSFCGFSAALAAMWFVYLQVFQIHKLCYYCLAVHTCGVIFGGLILWVRPIKLGALRQMGSAAAMGLVVLIVAQYNSPEPKTYEVVYYPEDEQTTPLQKDVEDAVGEDIFAPPGFEEEADDVFAPPMEDTPSASLDNDPDGLPLADASPIRSGGFPVVLMFVLAGLLVPSLKTNVSAQEGAKVQVAKKVPRLVPFPGGKTKLDITQWPLVGKPDARYAFVEMFDYTCDHCRKSHKTLKQACDKLNKDVAIISLPVPMAAACNNATTNAGHPAACELARLAVAVWRVDRKSFGQFHNWVLDQPAVPTTFEARNKANQLVGANKLTTELNKGIASKYVAKHVELYKRINKGSIPKFMFRRMAINGEPGSAQHLVDTIQQEAQQVVAPVN